MSIERTLSIIKPDATKRNLTGLINAKFENAGLKIIAQKRLRLTKSMAEKFYGIHKDRPFFNDLVDFMISGEIVAQVLEAENAVPFYRELMGDTNPEKAENDTLRKLYGTDIQCNAVHGSDSDENAIKEISFFFSKLELIN